VNVPEDRFTSASNAWRLAASCVVLALSACGDGSGPARERFSTVSPGFEHTCATITDGAALCAGGGLNGELGTGSSAVDSLLQLVAGVFVFQAVTTGQHHTCGLTVSGQGLCWGSGAGGQLGTGSTMSAIVPESVAGALEFRAISAGHGFTCGLTKGGWRTVGEVATAAASGPVPPQTTVCRSPWLGVGIRRYRCGGSSRLWRYCRPSSVLLGIRALWSARHWFHNER